ncbi:MAG: phenylacetate--CoA ligase family protein, partial [Alphaproteobacteria bacterium]|nr:phenylacetate--CoA ligase family protein [Alphaproteobacteria bacterium]
AMRLLFEAEGAGAEIADALAASLRDVTKLGGQVERMEMGSLPNDGKVISDERNYES